MGRPLLEKLAVLLSVGILAGGVWFWILMIDDVLETLRLAYG